MIIKNIKYNMYIFIKIAWTSTCVLFFANEGGCFYKILLCAIIFLRNYAHFLYSIKYKF